MTTLTTETIASYYANRDAAAGSNYTAMCEHAVVTGSHTSVKCRVCRGQGFFEAPLEEIAARYRRIASETDPGKRDALRADLSRESTCVVCKGAGYTLARRADRCAAMDTMWTTIRCGRCRGCGEAAPPTDASAEREDVCMACGGRAYIVPVSVKEKGSTKSGRAPRREAADVGDYLPDAPAEPHSLAFDEDEAMDRGRVARELESLGTQDPQLAAALASFHGPEGDEWVEHRWGREFTLWQHTTTGQQLCRELAERSPGRAGFLVEPTKRLEAARERLDNGVPQTRDDSRARVMLRRTDDEARELLQRVQAFSQQAEAAA